MGIAKSTLSQAEGLHQSYGASHKIFFVRARMIVRIIVGDGRDRPLRYGCSSVPTPIAFARR